MAAEWNRSERAWSRRRPSEEVLSTSASVGYRDRIVLVTGGNSGIGRAFVDRFVAEGASVMACGRNETTLQALKATHPSVEAMRCDVLRDRQGLCGPVRGRGRERRGLRP